MNLHAMQHLDKTGVAVIYNLAVADIQLGDLFHILVTELKIPDIYILLHALLMDGLGDHHNAPLHIPTQSHLGGAFAVLLADLRHHRMG